MRTSKASELFQASKPAGICIQDALDEIDRLSAINAALLEVANQILLESYNGNWPYGLEDILQGAKSAVDKAAGE